MLVERSFAVVCFGYQNPDLCDALLIKFGVGITYCIGISAWFNEPICYLIATIFAVFATADASDAGTAADANDADDAADTVLLCWLFAADIIDNPFKPLKPNSLKAQLAVSETPKLPNPEPFWKPKPRNPVNPWTLNPSRRCSKPESLNPEHWTLTLNPKLYREISRVGHVTDACTQAPNPKPPNPKPYSPKAWSPKP